MSQVSTSKLSINRRSHWTRTAFRLCSVAIACFGVCRVSDAQEAAKNQLTAELLIPVWQSSTIHGESSVLFQDSSDGDYFARVAFPVAKLISMHSSDRQKIVPIESVQVSADGHELRIARSFDLGGIVRDAIYLPANSPGSYRHRKGHPDQWMLYGPGRFFHEHQVEITYETKSAAWSDALPRYTPDLLPRTTAKLKSGSALSIGVSGDSISTGLDSSSTGKVPPHQDGYVELVGQKLRRMTSGEVKLTNRAVAGWSVANGVNDLDKLLESKPDLVIVAYGMNDVGRRDPAWYGQQVDLILEGLTKFDPNIEVILISTMVGNSEWVHTPREMFEPYRDELKKRVRKGVALADVTSLWLDLLKHKHDLDLTGNGLNHPNDFGHRLYAQAILSLLLPPEELRKK